MHILGLAMMHDSNPVLSIINTQLMTYLNSNKHAVCHECACEHDVTCRSNMRVPGLMFVCGKAACGWSTTQKTGQVLAVNAEHNTRQNQSFKAHYMAQKRPPSKHCDKFS